MEKFQQKIEEQKINIEKREKGDILIINGLEEDQLLDLALIMCKKLDKSYPIRANEKECLLSGQETRPGGCFAIRYDKSKGELVVDNRNARGDEYIREKMQKGVDSAIKKYNNEEDDEEIFKNLLKELKIGLSELDSGNMFEISGPSSEDLISIGLLIWEKLDDTFIADESQKDSLLSGKTIRLSSGYCIEFNSSVYVYNMKGDRNKLKDSIYSVIREYKK